MCLICLMEVFAASVRALVTPVTSRTSFFGDTCAGGGLRLRSSPRVPVIICYPVERLPDLGPPLYPGLAVALPKLRALIAA